MALTITEALAELKIIEKKISGKRDYIGGFLTINAGLKDPLQNAGGSKVVIERELQSIGDLQQRHVAIRTAIQKINQTTTITIAGVTKTIGEWLTYRKEIAPNEQRFIEQTRQKILQVRAAAHSRGQAILTPGQQEQKPTDIVVNVDEAGLAAASEKLDEILGALDGQLSLKNATTVIELQ